MSVLKKPLPEAFADHIAILGSKARWKQKFVPLTAANILGMFAAPVSILPAPGAGRALVVGQIIFQITRTSTAYASGGAVSFQYHTTTTSVPHAGSITAATLTTGGAGTAIVALGPNVGANGLVIPSNEGVDITNATGAFTTGTGLAWVWVQYQDIAVQ